MGRRWAWRGGCQRINLTEELDDGRISEALAGWTMRSLDLWAITAWRAAH
ncbi:MAG: hypothetical protein QOD67_893 [Caballeronia sp.]|nr:hypothetical protein [Caballeronia sp.]